MNLRLSARQALAQVASPPPSLALGELEPRLSQVEQLMRQLVLDDGVDHLSHMVLTQLSAGGRRVRARLALAAADAFGVPATQGIAWAASVELLHNATLIHDDIQDGDLVRRGKPTLWATHGVPQAINAGDLLLMLPYVALAEMPPLAQGRLAILLAETSARIVRGQASELDLLSTERLDRQSYYAAARGKTGALFELPVTGAAILGSLDKETVSECASLFGRLGLAFQIQDDILDLYGDKGKGLRGADIREGKVSALIVELLETRPDTREEVLTLLRKEREQTTDEDVIRVSELIRQSGALRRTFAALGDLLDEVEASPLCDRYPGVRVLAAGLTQMILGPLSQLPLDEVTEFLGWEGSSAS